MGSEKTCGTCKRVYQADRDIMRFGSQWRVCTAENLWFNCTCGSTLMVPKGKFPWYAPSQIMSNEASSLFNRMGALQELPHIPAAVMELQQLLTDPEVETSKLAQAIKADPFLATEVLVLASNMRRLRQSPARDKDARNLEYAITFIGHKHLSNLVATAALKKFQLKTTIFNHQTFWQHAFLTASIAEVLSKEFAAQQHAEKDRAYLAGSLCNIGKIVAALAYPAATDIVQQQVDHPQSQTTWEHAEECNDLPSHCTLGEIGAAFWGFPAFVMEAIKYHHTPPTASQEEVNEAWLCHLVCMANMLAHWLNLEPHRIDNVRLDLEASYFNLQRHELERLAKRLQNIVLLPNS